MHHGVIEPFSCFGSGCNRRIRFTDFGAVALSNQIVEITLVVTGKSGDISPLLGIGICPSINNSFGLSFKGAAL